MAEWHRATVVLNGFNRPSSLLPLASRVYLDAESLTRALLRETHSLHRCCRVKWPDYTVGRNPALGVGRLPSGWRQSFGRTLL
jgi:hypothetical protein